MEKTVERRGNGAAKVVEVVENAARNRTESSARGGSACAINFHAELLPSRVHPRSLYLVLSRSDRLEENFYIGQRNHGVNPGRLQRRTATTLRGDSSCNFAY